MKSKNITIRLATFDDIASIESMMKRSMKVLGEGHYSKEQINSCCQFVCVPDRQLIEDKTFFVAIAKDGSIVGCGGWSFRNALNCAGSKQSSSQKNAILNPATDRACIRAMFVDPLFSGKGIGSQILDRSEKAAKEHGFSKGILAATLSGFAFYKARGWISERGEQVTLPNRVSIEVILMEKNFS